MLSLLVTLPTFLVLLLLHLLLLAMLPWLTIVLLTVLNKVRHIQMHARVVGRVAPTHHDRVVHGLEVAVHVRAHCVELLIRTARFLIHLTLQGGANVVPCQRDDPHAVVVVLLGRLARAGPLEVGDPAHDRRDHVPNLVIKLLRLLFL